MLVVEVPTTPTTVTTSTIANFQKLMRKIQILKRRGFSRIIGRMFDSKATFSSETSYKIKIRKIKIQYIRSSEMNQCTASQVQTWTKVTLSNSNLRTHATYLKIRAIMMKIFIHILSISLIKRKQVMIKNKCKKKRKKSNKITRKSAIQLMIWTNIKILWRIWSI